MAIIYNHNIENLDEDLVLDSRFYDPEKERILNILTAQSAGNINKYFDEILDLTSTNNSNNFFPAINYDLPHSIGNVLKNGVKINNQEDLGSIKKIFESGDLIVSRLRYYLKELAIVPQKDINQIGSTEYVVLREKDKYRASILLPYLLSDTVQYIFSCIQRGSGHPRLASKDIFNLPFPRFLVEIYDIIAPSVEKAVSEFENSQKLYPEAELELLERMQWDKYNGSHVLTYKSNVDDILLNERLDPEFYQPKFKSLTSFISSKGAKTLNEICGESLVRGVQPSYFENGDVLVINSKHLGPVQIDIENAERTNLSFYNNFQNSKARLKFGDVLMYSTGAYIGRTNAFLENDFAIGSNHVTIIRPNSNICNPIYLALFLNSMPGLMQTDQRASGSAQREIYPQDISKFLVYIPLNKNGSVDIKWQNKLSNKVIESYQAKKQANEKLQNAILTINSEISKILKF